MRKNKKGFTLVELMVVMAIIAVIAVLIIGAIQLARQTANETVHRGNARTVQNALEAYYAKNKKYPATTSTGSFKNEAGAAILNVALTTANDCVGKLSGTIALDGGGYVEYTSSGYKLHVFNNACASEMTADLISVN